MLLTRRELPVLIANLLYIPIFLVVALQDLNFEFLLYIAVVLILGGWILWKQRDVCFDRMTLWGLTIWGFMHMAGGNLHINGQVLYNLTLIPILPAPYHVLRFDQFVHIFGFGIATLVCHHLLKPYLRESIPQRRTLAILIVLMGMGLGALNEMVEFLAVVSVPETNVGGYENTVIDLICNAIGAILAVILLSRRKDTCLSRPSCKPRG